jgi:opacity protein-like surface antigen
MRRLALAAALLISLSSAAQAAVGYSASAQRVLTQARAAAGGAGWNLLRGWHETGRRDGRRYEAWLDPVRYGLRVETHEPNGVAVHGFNGGGDWRISPTGQVTGADVRTLVSEGRTEAFFETRGYFYPGRFDARADLVGVRSFKGRSFDVVRVKPWGGTPRELWFDGTTHLLARMVDRSGGKPATIAFSDYRKVGPVRVAFRITDEMTGQVRELDAVDFATADRTRFSLPRQRAEVEEAAPTPGQ